MLEALGKQRVGYFRCSHALSLPPDLTFWLDEAGRSGNRSVKTKSLRLLQAGATLQFTNDVRKDHRLQADRVRVRGQRRV